MNLLTKTLVSGVALLAGMALAAPAMALGDTAIIMWNTANPGATFESALGFDEADLALSNIGGVTITASSVQRGTSPTDLTEANIGIRNTTGTIQVLRIIAGANGATSTTPPGLR